MKMSKTKRRPLTEAELKHAEKLRSLIESWQQERKANKERWGIEGIAHELEISQSALSQFKDGKIAPNLDAWRKICQFFEIQLVDIGLDLAAEAAALGEAAGTAEDDLFTSVRCFDVRASAGQGRAVFHYDKLEPFKIRTDFLLAQGGNEKNSFFVQAHGDSMEPTIPNGSDILVVDSGCDIVSGKIYVFFLNKEVYIKKLNKTQSGMMAVSDNRDYDPILITANDEFKLIGRVVMCSYRL